MPFLGTIVNFFAVLICGSLGMLVKKGVPERISKALNDAMAICVIYIGVSGMLESAPTVDCRYMSSGLVKVLIMVISMALGTLAGELIDIDKWVNKLGTYMEDSFAGKDEKGSFAEGFVTCSLLFCVGAMTVNGAFQDALGNPDILLTKSVIDGIMCFVLASSLGVGCVASSFFVLVYQGALTLIGLFLKGILPDTSIAYMSATGALVVILIGTNMLGATKVKTANLIPAIFTPALISPLILMIIS